MSGRDDNQTEEQNARVEQLRQRVIQFREEEAGDFAEEMERTSVIPAALWSRMRQLGLNKLTLPKWAGGEGFTLSQYLPILEEIARCHGSIRMVFHAYNSLWRPIASGSEAMQRAWLPKVASGEALIAFALTEPDNGTGIDLRTMATPVEGGGFTLNGRKHLITFAHEADAFVVIAKTNPEAGRQGLTAFLIPAGRQGMTLTPMAMTMGDKGCTHAVVTFEDCRVSEDEVIGEVGSGFDVALRGFLDQSRVCIATSAIGVAQESLEAALTYVTQRTTFGKPLSSRQAIQMKLAESAIAIQATRLLCRDAAAKFDAGQEIPVEAAMAKANAIEMVKEVTDHALQMFGGIGYFLGSPVERLYRDARSLWFEEGTIEMQKMTVVESLLAQARQRDRARRQAQTAE